MLAIVFPGQGSQQVGMAMDFARHCPASRQVLEEVDDALGLPLSRWMAEGPAERLERTEVTQPAVLAASTAIYRALEPELPARPGYFAGHSLGEYSALVAAGALTLGDAVRLVRLRARLMQAAVPEGIGGMRAVLGAEVQAVVRACDETPGEVFPASFNAPLQTVVAGLNEALAAAEGPLRAAGARKLQPLPVSAPFHCPLMRSAMQEFEPVLAETPLREALTPVISNASAQPYRTPAQARVQLRDQICAPVRWSETVRTLVAAGVRVQLEIGPGRVLTGLAPRIDRSVAVTCVERPEHVGPACKVVSGALA